MASRAATFPRCPHVAFPLLCTSLGSLWAASCSEAGGERPCPLKTLHNNPPSTPILLSPWGAAPVSGAVITGMPAACLQLIHTDPLCLSGPHRPPLSSSGGNIISKINAGAMHTSLLPPLCLLASSTWHRGPRKALLSPRILQCGRERRGNGVRRCAAGGRGARGAPQRPHAGHRHAAEQLRRAGGLGAARAPQRADHWLLPPLPEGTGCVCPALRHPSKDLLQGVPTGGWGWGGTRHRVDD